MKDELQQAIQDAIREDRKQTIIGLNNLEMPGVSSPELRGYNAGLKQAQDYIRVLNEREGNDEKRGSRDLVYLGTQIRPSLSSYDACKHDSNETGLSKNCCL